jgi:hypothetical protein
MRSILQLLNDFVACAAWVQGAIERRIPSKKKLRPIPGAYRAARKATWGGLWPSWVGVSDHHLTNAKEREVRAILQLPAGTYNRCVGVACVYVLGGGGETCM